MAYGSPPVLAGVTLPRPSSVSDDPEAVRNTVTLANGGTRAYHVGTRMVTTLSWARLSEAVLAQVQAIASSRPFVPYVHVNGVSYVMEVEPAKASPISGTDPVRFSVELTLREQDPR